MRYFIPFILVVMFWAIYHFYPTNYQTKQQKPIKQETIEFDLATAKAMIEQKEKLIVDVALKESITEAEYEQLEKSFMEEFGEHAQGHLMLFVRKEFDSDTQSEIYLKHDTFYPTTLHEGISVTDAVVHKSYYENEFFNRTYLNVTVEYTGDDPHLKGWKKGYTFLADHHGEWKLYGFSGRLNFIGEGFDMKYLEFK